MIISLDKSPYGREIVFSLRRYRIDPGDWKRRHGGFNLKV